MTDPVPSKESATPRTDAAQGAWELHGDRWVLADFAKQLERELTAARTALRGIQSCSTCEACRGAATLALGGVQPKPAHEREMPHCRTCACPPYQAPQPPSGEPQ